ncbi:MAG: hypothetical protein LRZ85_09185 [Alphaproteobacteria bacterium]|nr:hypothetical protein [Alphaproteobacteria bacterium]
MGFIRIFLAFMVLVFCATAAQTAMADCANPVAEEGVMVYNTNLKTMQFCNGTSWVSMVGGISSSNSEFLSTKWETVDLSDTANFDTLCEYRFQIGASWHRPVVVTISTLLFDAPIADWKFGAIEATSKDEYWYRNDGNIATTSGTPAPVAAMQKNCLDDVEPDAFTFNDVTNATQDTVITSNTVTITGINMPVTVSISGAEGTPELSINGGPWVTSGMIVSGQTLQLRVTSGTGFSNIRTSVMSIGSASAEWNVTTEAADGAPDAFTFTDLTGQAFNTLLTSNTVTITGINAGTPVSVSGDGSPEISINGGVWVTSGTIEDGQSLQIRLTSGNAYAVTRVATVDVGGITDGWSVKTVGQTQAYNVNSQTGCINGYCNCHTSGSGSPNAAKATTICVNQRGCEAMSSFTTANGPIGKKQCGWNGGGCFTNGWAGNKICNTVTCTGCP